MSTYYNIKTKLKIDQVDDIPGLSLEYSNDDRMWIRDRYNNILLCYSGSDDVIARVDRYGGNNSRFILYQLIVEGKSLILSEYTDQLYIHKAILERTDKNERVITVNYENAFEDETIEFIEMIEDNENFKDWTVIRPDFG